MINITIEAWPLASRLFGGDKGKKCVFKMEAPQDGTLGDLIGSLCENNPALAEVFIKTDNNELCRTSMSVAITLNAQVINSREGYQTKLQDGDRIVFVQGFSGG